MTTPKTYPLDNSGLYHIAILQPGKANIFRQTTVLTHPVDPALLQQALDAVAPRFPVLVCGIQNGKTAPYLVPVKKAPKIQPDTGVIEYMPPERLRVCAMRVLYKGCRISVEFFHSLTDGYGGFTFMKALVAEYLRLAYGVDCGDDPAAPPAALGPREIEDSFLVNAGGEKAAFNNVRSYLPGEKAVESDRIHTTTAVYDVNSLLALARSYGVSLTTLLAAVMTRCVLAMQKADPTVKKPLPVKLMVPADLRRRFASVTVRNFSLYAMPCIPADYADRPFTDLVQEMDAQLKAQFTPARLKAMMTTNAALDQNPLVSRLPLGLKCLALKTGFRMYGLRGSALSVSNLGQWVFPAAMRPYIEGVRVYLSPRVLGPYNSGAVTCDGKLYYTFTRRSHTPRLEPMFFGALQQLGCIPIAMEVDEAPADVDACLNGKGSASC